MGPIRACKESPRGRIKESPWLAERGESHTPPVPPDDTHARRRDVAFYPACRYAETGSRVPTGRSCAAFDPISASNFVCESNHGHRLHTHSPDCNETDFCMIPYHCDKE